MSTGDNLRKIADVIDKLDENVIAYELGRVEGPSSSEVFFMCDFSEFASLGLHSKDEVSLMTEDFWSPYPYKRSLVIDGIEYFDIYETEAEAREG